MMSCKRKFSLVDRFLGRSFDGGQIKNDIFSDWCFKSHSLYRRDLFAHFGCVNAVEFSNDGTIFVSGSDDRRVLLWSISETFDNSPKSTPTEMEAEHGSNVFCLAVSLDNQRIFSGGNDLQAIIHDTKSAKPVDYFLHEKPVYGISLQSDNQNVFATACDDGKLRIFDMRSSTSPEIVLASKRSPFHSVMFHPIEGRIVASGSAKDGPELWDVRNPLICLHRYPNEKGAMSVRFNSCGDKLLCLRRREPPKIYDLFGHSGDVQLMAEGYKNACTMKSCCFAGDRDEFAVSGSDDHNIYVWKVPKCSAEDVNVGQAHMILKGHRSVVNHVRYNPATCSLASCGVEKIVKIWSPIAFPLSSGGLDSAEEPKSKRRVLRLPRDQTMIIAPSPNYRSTEEDKKMLAFFDLLVERSTWISSCDEETSDEDDEEEDLDEYSNTSRSTSLSSSGNDEEESFEIDSVSTPDDDDEPVAGPSGLSNQQPAKLELPEEFYRQRRALPLRSIRTATLTSTSSSESEHEATGPVVFRPLPGPIKTRQFRRRTSSSTSSSSSS